MSDDCNETHSCEDSSAVETRNNHIFRRLHARLTDDEVPVDWEVIHSLLHCLVISDTTCEEIYSSPQDDPTGRLLIAKILARRPPPAILDTAITIFPHSLHQNPAAFLVASKLPSTDILKLMFQKISQEEHESCPYPWILSEQVSVETCRTILEMFPEGVMQSSAFLSSLNLLDYFLIAPEIVDRRKFDITLWSKFKLVLVAAGCMVNKGCTCSGSEIAPVHLILNRVLSRPDFWNSPAIVEHVLWLLHQLRWTDPWIFQKESIHGRYPIHVVLSYRCPQDQPGLVAARALTQLLLEACPLSASVRFNGKTTSSYGR